MQDFAPIWPKIQWLIQAAVIVILINAIRDYRVQRDKERQESQCVKDALEYKRRIAEERYLYECPKYRDHWRDVRQMDQRYEVDMARIRAWF